MKKTWLDECAEEAEALSVEKRQEFVDCMRKKRMTLGDAAKECGITFNAANGIMSRQIETLSATVFNPIAK